MDDINLDADHECTETYRECIESKRRLVKAADAANPTASSRELAKTLPVSPSTVQRSRRSPSASGDATTRERDPSGVKASLRANPDRSNMSIAKSLGVKESTVRQARKRLGMSPSTAIAGCAAARVITATEHKETIQEALDRGKYSHELMDWIFTYQSWSKRLQKQAREVFFAIINGVSTNGAVATQPSDSACPLDGAVTTH